MKLLSVSGDLQDNLWTEFLVCSDGKAVGSSYMLRLAISKIMELLYFYRVQVNSKNVINANKMQSMRLKKVLKV